ncbi:MAG: selenocysteine-specific translation elongation factor [Candidatus Marinimicrobia bacterium]|jgi:selenocysteine-specific elongation factor|nr:selenocysteine-specific translation elongation factor [Candidatus Neomarinimicrobiota bacterium]MDP6852588.1 selenocysteine-specific translation elongation factor [Candidatus Neomarinimicrobiota bacterium]MDP6936007.1 selenocysteine-specific translation elongation factor [Candidatus Neomarinimicrobiota bacterium]
MNQTVIGLSGHIDHGKTALVQALTGVNTDKLQEEQQRGMTIDIGFAFLNENTTLIDVPGHEKFVKNMMAGVSGIDVALLVVAADDGVMPQTREHFEILNLLDIPLGLIALNKVDLADEDWLDLVELDITELVKGSFMEEAPIIRVSAVEGTGVENLKSSLVEICSKAPDKLNRGIFRMHVDRAFSMKGYGTVVTGTVNSGELHSGDSIEILPGEIKSKVRGLQSHSREVEEVTMGDRAAINLQGIDKEHIQRGSQISEPGYLQAMTNMGVALHLLSSSKKSIEQNQRVRIHLGTQEVMARIALTGAKSLQPGNKGAAMLRLESPLVAARGDKFIIRSYSPIITIGGGEVLDVVIEEKWKVVKNKIQDLFNHSDTDQILQLVSQEGAKPLTVEKLKFRLGVSPEQIEALIKGIEPLQWVHNKHHKWLVTREQWQNLKSQILLILSEFHKRRPLESGAQKEEIRQQLKSEESLLELLLQELQKENKVVQNGKVWADSQFKLSLNNEDDSLQTDILSILDKEGFTSSNLAELSTKTGHPKDKLLQVLKVAEQQGKILRLDGNIMFTRRNFLTLKSKIQQHFMNHSELSVPQFKEIAQTSRKYAVPLLEYFDKMKITFRAGNARKLVQ